MRTMKNIFRTSIDVIGYVKTDQKRYENKEEKPADEPMQGDADLQGEEDEADQALDNQYEKGFTDEQIKKFKEFAASPQVYDLLIDALAPSIWENHDVKKGILC